MADPRLNYSFPYPFEFNPSIACAKSSLLQPFYQAPTTDIVALMKLRNAIQAQILQLQIANLNLMSTASMAALNSSLKTCDTASPYSVTSNLSSEVKPVNTNTNELLSSENSDMCLEARVKYMLQFFVSNFGRVAEKDIQIERQKFSQDERLLKVFDLLVSKYSATTKTREEMIKWIIRRALKCCKQSMKGKSKASAKELSKDLCKKYFKGIQEGKIEEEAGVECVDSLLPFRKNSKNKTMNANFISEIFGSEEFRGDYRNFLNDFDTITEKDTVKKISKFSCFLIECVKKGTIGNISKYKRVPWLRIWVQNTKKVAIELEEGNFDDKSSKRVKSEGSEIL